MNLKLRQIEVDAATAEALEARAAERGVSVSELLAELVAFDVPLPDEFQALRAAGKGPWSPEALAEDARELAEFERTGMAVPLEDVRTWMASWGTDEALPSPKPRKL